MLGRPACYALQSSSHSTRLTWLPWRPGMLRRCLQSTRSVCLCYESSLPMQRDRREDNRRQTQSAALLQRYNGQPRFRRHSVTVLEPRVVLGGKRRDCMRRHVRSRDSERIASRCWSLESCLVASGEIVCGGLCEARHSPAALGPGCAYTPAACMLMHRQTSKTGTLSYCCSEAGARLRSCCVRAHADTHSHTPTQANGACSHVYARRRKLSGRWLLLLLL
jgi:hypothetical protein